MHVRQPVQLARQQRVGALPILLGQALQRRDDVPGQPRREPSERGISDPWVAPTRSDAHSDFDSVCGEARAGVLVVSG